MPTLLEQVSDAFDQIKAGAGLEGFSGLGWGDREQGALLGAGVGLLLGLVIKGAAKTPEDEAAKGVATGAKPYADALNQLGQAAVSSGTAAGRSAITGAFGGKGGNAGGGSPDWLLPAVIIGGALMLSKG